MVQRKRSAKKKRKRRSPATKSQSLPELPGLPSELSQVPPEALQSIESVLAGLGGRSFTKRNPTAVDRAQEIMYEAWEATSGKSAIMLAQKALAISPDCADAYNLLASRLAGSVEESIGFYLLAMLAGERALGRQVFEEDAGHFWGLLETRPYMRARAGLAFSLWEAGQHAEAVEHWWELLRLNPDDNQGIRDFLMSALIELGRDEDAERLYAQYPEECMAIWAYSRALLDFRKHGDADVSSQSLTAALESNQYVPSYLLSHKKLPEKSPSYIGFGDENEAIAYAEHGMALWANTPGALKWLAGKLK